MARQRHKPIWALAPGVCALALTALAMSACHGKSSPSAKIQAAQNGAPSGFPQWAFPGTLSRTVPGGKRGYSNSQIYDRTSAVDWFPNDHPAMPDVVKGRQVAYACGFCHLPQGAGRDEDPGLAGLPYRYILQQIADFKSGARFTPDPRFWAAISMQLTARQTSDADADQAAKYYSGLKYDKHFKVIESTDVPHFSSNAFVYVFDNGPREPLGQRIIEGPDDFERFDMRDPTVTYTAYVPVGSIARGGALAKGGGGVIPACETCHGAGLRGAEIGPPIAGRLPTGLFRQLYAFQSGARNGVNAAPMKGVVAGMSRQDMIDLSAYVASLDP